MNTKEIISKLTDSQKERLLREAIDFAVMNDKIKQTRPDSCPCCGKQARMIKKGFAHGKQRYQCKECGKKFVYDSHTITSGLKIEKEQLIEICLDTLSLVPIAQTAARLDLSIQCVFRNRHKFLTFLEQLLAAEPEKLSGTCEFDETYIQESCKGSKPKNRKARHRGEPSCYRGISREKVCIVTTTDRTSHEIFKAVGLAKPTQRSILENFEESIEKGSILYVDGTNSYDQLADKCLCGISHLITKSSYNKVEHLNNVNAIHRMIKNCIQTYRGIATKYIHRYCALFRFLRKFLVMDRNEMADQLLRFHKTHIQDMHMEKLKIHHIFGC